MNADTYEQSGVLYLGAELDPEPNDTADPVPTEPARVEPVAPPADATARPPHRTPLLYDSRDLTTHAVCVGMTGSGKTGLGIVLLEECAIDGVPAIIIDPKGDMGNLLLGFPDLTAADFQPWTSPDDARRRGQTLADTAAANASRWRDGLLRWGQDGERIRRMHDATRVELYTPGLAGGRPIALLRAMHAPGPGVLDDPDLLLELISSTATSLLALMGLSSADPRSREHTLISALIEHAWTRGQDVDLPWLVSAIQRPPFDRLGVLDLEQFFAERDRTQLARQLNTVLAAPGFRAWLEGEPLDIDALLYTPDGRPRHSVLTISHLSDDERMVFVTMLLGELIAWMRRQRGTSSLRALLYMDEVFGFLPPVAEPPSKRPLMTLLKQARAFGLGVMLATQNPADIDYKALANTGTWIVGRLQTERDKQRLLSGMEAAMDAGHLARDRATLDRWITSLAPRQFVLHNVHRGHPQRFEARWALSWLPGPLDRDQVIRLARRGLEATTGQRAQPDESSPATQTTPAATPAVPPPGIVDAARDHALATAPALTATTRQSDTPRLETGARLAGALGIPVDAHPPVLPAGANAAFVPVVGDALDGEALLYRPMLLGCADVAVHRQRPPVQWRERIQRVAALEEGPVGVDWEHAHHAPFDERALERGGQAGGWFLRPPASVVEERAVRGWQRRFEAEVVRAWRLRLLTAGGLTSEPGGRPGRVGERISVAARA